MYCQAISLSNDPVKSPEAVSAASLLRGYSFSAQEAHEARDLGGLLCLRLDTNYTCNLSCRYCYAGPKMKENRSVLPISKAKYVVDEAHDFGAKSVVYLGGGEPFLYPNLWTLISYISSLGMVPVVFTNGTLLSKESASRLYDFGSSVIVKFDGFESTQDSLSGAGTGIRIRRGFDLLLESGFADLQDGYTRLGASILVCSENHLEVPELWRFLRLRNVFPDIERITIVGNASSEMNLTPSQIQAMIAEIRSIDINEFHIQWASPFSSIPGHSCFICISGCHVTADYRLSICPEMSPVLNLNSFKLADALKQTPFSDMRNIENTIQAPCRTCSHIQYCLGGCRSKAFCHFGSIFAPDPYCQYVSPNRTNS